MPVRAEHTGDHGFSVDVAEGGLRLASCRIGHPEEPYIEPMPDGTMWKLYLLKGGRVVKGSRGNNGCPNCRRMFTELKDRSRKCVL